MLDSPFRNKDKKNKAIYQVLRRKTPDALARSLYIGNTRGFPATPIFSTI